ncbi:TPA: hypothetical protein ACH3X3_007088 [Trebouxia sp. C0006]
MSFNEGDSPSDAFDDIKTRSAVEDNEYLVDISKERRKKGWVQLDYLRQDQLPGSTDFKRNCDRPLWCNVLELKPKLRLMLSDSLAHESARKKTLGMSQSSGYIPWTMITELPTQLGYAVH